jgi:hypothetical protein
VRYFHTAGTAAQRAEEWRVRLWPDGRPLDARHIIPDSAPAASADSAALRRIALAALTREGIDTSRLKESDVKETARPARRDVTVTYTDTSVKLPAGAAAQAWVQIAGDEPLVARRGVELPEEFLRADRARETTQMLITGASILLLLGMIVAGAIVVKRRSPIVVNDGVLDRRNTFILVGVIVVLATLSSLNSLPAQLFRYDTTQSWGNFIGTTALGFLLAIPLALFALGMWLALGAMRRRVGIPMLPAEPSRSTRNEILISGLGLGGLVYGITHFEAFVPRTSMPRVPTTTLNLTLPMFAGVPEIAMSVLMMIALVGLPFLVVAGLTRRWSMRALYAAALLTPIAAVVWSAAPESDVDSIWGVILVVGFVALITLAFVAWGSRSAWSWIVAALASYGLGGLREAAYAPVGQARIAGALAFLVASGLIVVIARRTSQASQPPQARAIPPETHSAVAGI